MKTSADKVKAFINQHAKDYGLPVAKVRHYYHLSKQSRRSFYAALDGEVGLTERSPMHKIVNRVIFSKPALLEIVTEFETVQEFEDRYPNAYLHAKKKGWLRECFPHLSKHASKQVYKLDECVEVAKSHRSWRSFVMNKGNMYAALVARGDIKELKVRAGFSRSLTKNKRYKSCLDNALTCESWSDFRFAFKKDYAFLARHKLSPKAKDEFYTRKK